MRDQINESVYQKTYGGGNRDNAPKPYPFTGGRMPCVKMADMPPNAVGVHGSTKTNRFLYLPDFESHFLVRIFNLRFWWYPNVWNTTVTIGFQTGL